MLFPNTADSEGQFTIQLANPLGDESQRSASQSAVAVKAVFLVGPKKEGGEKQKIRFAKNMIFFFPLFQYGLFSVAHKCV